MSTPSDILGTLLTNTNDTGLQEIPLTLLDDNPFQEREDYGDLTDLAADIREHGLLQPPLARRAAGRYQLAFGHRRKRACEVVGMSSMPVVVREISDERMATMAYSENQQRSDVTPIDKARAIQRMILAFGWTHQEVADKLSISRPTVSNLLRLLTLPHELQEDLASGAVSARQAEAMLPVYQLPQPALARLNDRKNNWRTPASLIDEARRGSSSDDIRRTAALMIKDVTREIPEHWGNMAFEVDGVTSPTCTDCPERIGADRRCYILACWERKSAEWQAIENQRFVRATGFPMAPEQILYDEYTSLHSSDIELLRDVIDRHGCPNLKLSRRSHCLPDGTWIRGDQPGLICHHPGKKFCACKVRIAKDNNKASSALWRSVRQDTSAALRIYLHDQPEPLLRLMAASLEGTLNDFSGQRSKWATEDLEEVARFVSDKLIKLAAPWEPEKHGEGARGSMERMLAIAGIIPPWSLLGQAEPAGDDVAIPTL